MYNLTSDPNALIKFESDMFEVAAHKVKWLKSYRMGDFVDIMLAMWKAEESIIAKVVDDLEVAKHLFFNAYRRSLTIEYFTRQIEARMEM